MRFRLKAISYITLFTVLVFLLPQGINAESLPPELPEELDSGVGTTGSDCTSIQLDLTADTIIPVPTACADGLCKLILYTNSTMGAFSDGYSWEVYIRQWGSEDSWTWFGGPNINFGGVSFSDGYGQNGNGISEGIFLGATTYDGGYIRILDDGDAENDPNLWTIESQASRSLTSVSLHACDLSGYWTYDITSSTSINMPPFCLDNLCMILRYSFASFGDFGQGFLMPVYYDQNSANDHWIGGPNISMAYVPFSDGSGTNDTGSGSMSSIFDGGVSDAGGSSVLLDDGAEWFNTQWSVLFSPSADLTWVRYYIVPMGCTKHPITDHANLDVPAFCMDSLCTIARWTDASMGVFGPGIEWPVNYKQNTFDNTWKGGPNVCYGGMCFNDGSGFNGDPVEDMIFEGGLTFDNDGYVWLQDDDNPYEMTSYQWNVEFYPQDDLTEAAYYFCSNSCEETIFLINKQYLPLNNK